MHAIEVNALCTLVDSKVQDEDDGFPADSAERIAYRCAAIPGSRFTLSSDTKRAARKDL